MTSIDETTTTHEPNLMFEQALVPVQEGLVSLEAQLAATDGEPLYVRASARERDIEALKTFTESLRVEITPDPRPSDKAEPPVAIDAWVADALLDAADDPVFLLEVPVDRELGGMGYKVIAYADIGDEAIQHWKNGSNTGSVRITVSAGQVQLKGKSKSYTRTPANSPTPWASTNGTCWTKGKASGTSSYTISDGWRRKSALVDDEGD